RSAIRFLETAAPEPRATPRSIPRLASRSPDTCHTWAVVGHKTSPAPVRRSPKLFEHSRVPLAPESPSGGVALAHCDAAPVTIARDRFAPAVPGSEHRADHLFDCSW